MPIYPGCSGKEAAKRVSVCLSVQNVLNIEKPELRELLGLEPVSLVIGKGELVWFGRVKHENDTDWIECCTMLEVTATHGCRRKMVMVEG